MKNKFFLIISICLLSGYFLLKSKTSIAPVLKKDNGRINISTSSDTVPVRVSSFDSEISPKSKFSCREYLKLNTLNSKWRRDKQNFIKTFLAQTKFSSLDKNILDKVYIKSGIGLYRGRQYKRALQMENKLPPYFYGSAILATFKQENMINNIIKSDNYDSLGDNIKNDNVFFMGKTHLVFILGKILENSQTINQHIVEQIIDSGIQVTYSDLMLATKMNIPVKLMNKIFNSSDLHANVILTRFGVHTSLAIEALKNKNPELFLYWSSKGSSLQLNFYDKNAMDILLEQSKLYNKNTFLKLFQTIESSGVYQNLGSSTSKLKELIPKNTLKAYLKTLKNNRLSTKQIVLVNNIVDDIHIRILDKVVIFDLQDPSMRKCFSILGKQLTEFASIFKSTKKEIKYEDTIDGKSKSMLDNGNTKLVLNSENDIEANQGIELSLENKQAIENFRQKKVVELSRDYQKKLVNDKNDKMKDIIGRLYRLAKEQKWDEVLSLSKQLDASKSEIFTILLRMAISTNADINIIKTLLDNGGNLLPSTINQLIINKNIFLAKNLLEYGLVLNYIDPMGHSVLTQAVIYHSAGMLNFLIDEGVEINNSSVGYNALDFAIKQFHGDFTYISILLSSDALIETSHKELVSRLRASHFNLYMKLIERFPELVP